ncbi:hypothetical protein SmJEL517_g01888 [Synchytrium microbalum]|uniref:Uncharacterized protein n=1 Tax=Synchytrium microbalum TaxID=1806994 RepID=A0A507CCR5_9FUNG|nr:uncharacterized protein SmJEL517_g01888 [Synchytrium microbalum]TPX35714.1 hypothetical protein SmJEL517_g01888 [Synchytrium microbalum]
MRLFVYIITWIIAIYSIQINASVVGIDYGLEWFKVSIVKPGVPLEIVLNKESKRKTQSIVTLRNHVRSFSTDAVNAGTRYPQDTYLSLKNLLGRKYHDKQATEYRDSYPNRLLPHPHRESCSFKADDGDIYTTEELVAMQLAYAKSLAQDYGAEAVSGAVITVPPYFNHFERQAILDAAEIAGLRVYSLMNDATAIALNYAMTRTFATPQYHIIYDMGAGSTAASLVHFQDTSIKDGNLFRNKTVPQITIKATGSDHTLGGSILDSRLLNRFITHFQKEKSLDARESPRAMAKLLKEASRVKQVLSANNQVMASVEGLMNDVDFKMVVMRSDLEEDCKDVFGRVTAPIAQVLDEAKLTLADITSVILHGGGSRIPAIQNALREYLGESMIAQNVNMDEAAVMGAGLRAAALSKQFKVREIGIKDVNEFPINIVYEAESKDASPPRSLKMTLFPENGAMGAKKLMNFQRKSDFSFDLSYSNESVVILRAQVKGLTSAINGAKTPLLSSKVKATVELADAGTLHVRDASVFLEVEKNATASNIFDKVTSFFGGKKSDNETDKDGGEDQAKEEVGDSSTESNATTSASTKTTSTAAAAASAKETSSVEQVKLDVTVEYPVFPPLQESVKATAKKRLSKMDAEDKGRLAREEARNTLEAFIYSARDFLQDTGIHSISTEAQRSAFESAISEHQSWLFDSADEQPTHEFVTRLEELQKIKTPFVTRRNEVTARPEAIEALRKAISGIQTYIEQDLNTDKEGASKWDRLLDGIKKVESWVDTKSSEQDLIKSHEDPVLTSSDIEAKAKDIQSEFVKIVRLAAAAKAKKASAASASAASSKSAAASASKAAAAAADKAKATPSVADGGDDEKSGEGGGGGEGGDTPVVNEKDEL